MSYRIENDRNAENFEGTKGRGLDWTLYDGDLVHEFCVSQDEAETVLAAIRDDARDRVERLREDLEEAEFDLQEMLGD